MRQTNRTQTKPGQDCRPIPFHVRSYEFVGPAWGSLSRGGAGPYRLMCGSRMVKLGWPALSPPTWATADIPAARNLSVGPRATAASFTRLRIGLRTMRVCPSPFSDRIACLLAQPPESTLWTDYAPVSLLSTPPTETGDLVAQDRFELSTFRL